MPRVLRLIATAAILAPLAGHFAVVVIDACRAITLSIAGFDIARIVEGGDLASLVATGTRRRRDDGGPCR